jgi:hypothetical protein
MSLQHIVSGGLKDVSLDVKDLNCTSITVNNAPIESFDQDLNTTSDVRFNQLRLTSTMFTDPQQAVNKEYVDNSAPGLGSLQSAYDGGNTILTQAGFPVEVSGPEGITVTKTVFTDPQDLVTKEYVDNATPSVTLQEAYDNGSTITTVSPVDIQGDLNSTRINTTELTIEKCVISNPATNDLLIDSDSGNGLISLNATAIRNLGTIACVDPGLGTGIQMNSQEITTDKLVFTNQSELISKRYVDDSIGSIPTVTLQTAYDNGSTITASAGPVDVVGDINVSTLNSSIIDSTTVLTNILNSAGSPSISTNSSITTSKITFTDSQEFVSKSYVDSTSTSQPNQSITWSLQGVLDEYDTLTSIQTIPLSSVVSGNLSINYPGVGTFQELNPTVRTGNILTVPSTAWYSIRLTYSHPSLPIIGTNAQAGLGSDCKVFIKINGSNRIPLGQEDSGAGITESISVVVDRYLTANSTIEFEWQFGAAQNNEDFFINCSATPTLNGVEGLVPAPSAGQEFATLLGSGSFLNLSAPAIIDMYGQEIINWSGRISPGLVGLNFAGSTSYQTNSNNYFLNIVNAGSQVGYINFDALQSYDKFKFEFYYKILFTTQPADVLGFFGCGTQVNSGNETNTGGLTFDTDYFAGGSFNYETRITDGTGGIITPYQLRGYQEINTDAYNKLTMTRFGQNVTIDLEGGGGKYSLTSNNFIQTFTGTRFGIVARTGGNSMNVEINNIKLIAF